MKRILAALLTLTLTVAFLAACNGGKDPAPTETTPNAQTQPSGSDMSVTEPSGEPTSENTTENTSQSENTAQSTEQTSAETQQTTKNPLIETSGSGGNSGGNSSSEDLNRYYVPNTYSYFTPKSSAVSLSWFDDAVFMGDSRSVGLVAYTGLTNSTTAKDYTKVY